MLTPQLLYYDLGPDVTAFSTTRHGGYSTGAYGELNINPYCGDDPEAVAKNREALAAVLSASLSSSSSVSLSSSSSVSLSPIALLLPHQVHGTACRVVDAPLLALRHRCAAFHAAPASAVSSSSPLEGVDAVLTNLPGICIGVSTADCIPILLYDPVHHAAAAIHAGWRGTVQRIAEVAVRTMATTYGTRPEELKAVIGPGISLRNFEVGQEVYDAFAAADFPMSRIAHRYNKWHLDLPLCNALQLESTGIPAANIHQSNICTYDRVADFFSARRLGQASGRIYTAISLS